MLSPVVWRLRVLSGLSELVAYECFLLLHPLLLLTQCEMHAAQLDLLRLDIGQQLSGRLTGQHVRQIASGGRRGRRRRGRGGGGSMRGSGHREQMKCETATGHWGAEQGRSGTASILIAAFLHFVKFSLDVATQLFAPYHTPNVSRHHFFRLHVCVMWERDLEACIGTQKLTNNKPATTLHQQPALQSPLLTRSDTPARPSLLVILGTWHCTILVGFKCATLPAHYTSRSSARNQQARLHNEKINKSKIYCTFLYMSCSRNCWNTFRRCFHIYKNMYGAPGMYSNASNMT